MEPHFDSRSRIFELDPCSGNGKVCLVYKDCTEGTHLPMWYATCTVCVKYHERIREEDNFRLPYFTPDFMKVRKLNWFWLVNIHGNVPIIISSPLLSVPWLFGSRCGGPEVWGVVPGSLSVLALPNTQLHRLLPPDDHQLRPARVAERLHPLRPQSPGQGNTPSPPRRSEAGVMGFCWNWDKI